ncbi:hypothetical protein D3C72_1507320 [compost metagenome]
MLLSELPVAVVIHAVITGITAGPRLPRLLISAMPPAADLRGRYSLMAAKKIGVLADWPMLMTARPASASTRLPPLNTATSRPAEASATQKKKCLRRSRCLSELRPTNTMPTAPKTAGMADSRPTMNTSPTPQFLMSVGTRNTSV